MRIVAYGAAFDLQGRVLEDKRSLLISVALETRNISAHRQSCLFQLKATVRVVAVVALDLTLEHLVVEGHAKLRLHLGVATDAKLWLAGLQHFERGSVWLQLRSLGNESYGLRFRWDYLRVMRRVTIRATDAVDPVRAAQEIIVLIVGMAGQTRLRGLFRRFALERNDLSRVAAAVYVSLAWTVTLLAAGHFRFPARQSRKLRVLSVGKSFELVFVTELASLAADVVVS